MSHCTNISQSQCLLEKALWSCKKTRSNSTNKTTCKHTEPPWAQSQMVLALTTIFMWKIEKQILTDECAHKSLAWNVVSTTKSPSDTSAEMMLKSSLGKQINTIQRSNLRLRYHVQMRVSWTPLYTRIQQRVSSRCKNTLQTNGDIPGSFFTTCHPPKAKKGFVKAEALWLLRTNFSNKTFAGNNTTFKKHHMETGYPENFINNTSKRWNFKRGQKPSFKGIRQRKESSPW